jgi:hypothetical protein
MDIQEKQAFEAEFEKTDFYKMNLVNCFCFITDRYVWDEVQAAWEMWQAATTRMEIRINTLDEMLLNQGEALAQAKAQAVPEWIDVSDRLPEEGEEVFVHHYGHIVQATRDKKYSGGFKQRNCYGWESVSCYVSHWMPMSVKLPESVHFYYEHDAKVAKEKAMIEAREPTND